MKKFTLLILLLNAIYCFAQPPSGNSLYFDGSEDYIQFTSVATDAVSDVTFELWYYPEAIVGWQRIFDFGKAQGENIFLTPSPGDNPNYPRFVINLGAGEQQINSSIALSTGQWYHIAVSLSANTGRMYIDGTLVGENTSFTYNPADLGTTNNNYIGKSQYPDPLLYGLVDEFRIWNYARTADSILLNMNTSYTGNEEGLVAYYNFNGDACANTIKDLAGDYTGTLYNEPLFVNNAEGATYPHSFSFSNITTYTSTLSWEAPPVGIYNHYRLIADDNEDFSSPEIIADNITDLFYEINEYDVSGSFYYKVEAHNSLSSFSSCTQFADLRLDAWQQIGTDIDGEASGDFLGYSVSLSADGLTMATGARFNSENGTDAGHVRIYNYDNTSSNWVQLGTDIDGEADFDYSGSSVSLSADGLTAAIGAPYNDGNGTDAGHVRIYNYDNTSSNWVQLGADIDGEAINDYSGTSVSLSADGLTAAIGANYNDGNGTDAGHVRIYNYDNTSSNWVQLGTDIDGEASGDYSGRSVSLSADGLTAAIGAPYNNGNGFHAGHVRIYNYDNTSSDWVQLGADIDGEASDDYSGVSVSLSADGLTAAIGAPYNDGNGSYAGHVRIYNYDNTSSNWVQLGTDIDGEASLDFSGTSVSLSADGLTAAIGANRNDGNGTDAGHVRIYNYDNTSSNWVQLGADINGEASSDRSGNSVSLSADGLIAAIGAAYNDGNGSYAGHVRIFGKTPVATSVRTDAASCPNEILQLSASGCGIYSYQWQLKAKDSQVWIDLVDDTQYTGTTSDTLTITTSLSLDSCEYRCELKNAIFTNFNTATFIRVAKLIPDVISLPEITGECSVDEPSAPTATQLCSGLTITGTTTTIFPITVQCDSTITWTYDDGNGNSITQIQKIIVKDVIAPIADAATLTDITGECSVNEPTAPTATDNCSGTITGTTTTIFPITVQCDSTITWTYVDVLGNTSTQTQKVIVKDVTAPIADAATLTDITGECSVNAPTAPTATDNCSGAIVGTTITVFPIAEQCDSTITWTFDDGNGNTSTQTQKVIVKDVTAPIADAATLTDITGECSVNAPTAPTATDNCSGAIVGTTITVFPITEQCDSTITWTFDDGNGNTSTQTQRIVINDVTAPVADAASLPELTDECSVDATAPTATDNCSGAIVGTTITVFPITEQCDSIITWTFDDGNGNTSIQTQHIVINDVTAPNADVATLVDITGECSVNEPTAPTATDYCSGTITGTTTTIFPITVQCDSTITWTYVDAFGNESTQTQKVIVKDVTAPVADAATLADITGECAVETPTAPTATDNCSGAITGTTATVFPISVQCDSTITWTYIDAVGNISTQTQKVIVKDITVPVADAASLADVTGECTVDAPTAPTATDNCSGTIIGTTVTVFPITVQCDSTISWTFVDAVGNESTQTQKVIVKDVTAPVADAVTLADLIGECSVEAPTVPTAIDNCSGTIIGTTITVFPITVQCDSTITWSFDDGNGNISTQTQKVIVKDITAPVADAASLADVTGECSVDAPTAPTASDNCLGVITGTTTTIFPITVQCDSTITWTFDDGNGNTVTQIQRIVIDDITAPVADAASLADITGECAVETPTAPTATDNCSGAITGTTATVFPITVQCDSTITWTFVDAVGNISTQTQKVIVKDITAPVADAASLADITGECAVETPTAPKATDNCSGAITGTTTTIFPITVQCDSTIIWTFVDAAGNISTQTQKVIVKDITVPVADAATLVDITGECAVEAPTAPTATDNCSGAIVGTTITVFPITEQCDSTITWTFVDVVGNISTQTQKVIVKDITVPVADAATLVDITGECAVEAPTAPTATDNCSGAIVGTTITVFPITEQCDSTITWTFVDVVGNISTQTQKVIVKDITVPVADAASLADVTGECTVDAPTAPTATDNCLGVITGTTTTLFPITIQCDSTIIWTYDDGNGNTFTQTQNVIIKDITVPEINCIADVSVDLVAGDTLYIVAGDEFDPLLIDDNCTIVSISNSLNNDETLANVELPEGKTTVVWTVTDIAGNTAECSSELLINGYVGVESSLDSDISVYPNPTSALLNIDFKQEKIELLQVIDLNGKVVYSTTEVEQQQQIDFSNYGSGIYIISIQTTNKLIKQKVVKE